MDQLRILVAGGKGFLGWNLIRYLRQCHPDANIVCLDNMWTGAHRSGEMHSSFVECNVEAAQLYLKGQMFDYVYHLASPASPSKYQSDPVRTIKSNVWGLNELLHVTKPSGTLFFASSSEVYGDPLVSPQPESYKGQVSTTGPRACYDESKRLCETLALEWAGWRYGGGVKIARLFNVYGPGTLPEDGRAISNFVWAAMNGQPLLIHGTGLQTRAFTCVDDVIPAIVRLTEHTPDLFTGPINIGTSVETTVFRAAVTVLDVVLQWQKKRGEPLSESVLQFAKSPVDDPRQRLPDLTLCRQVLGWDTSRLVQLADGIRNTVEFFDSEYGSRRVVPQILHKKLEAGE